MKKSVTLFLICKFSFAFFLLSQFGYANNKVGNVNSILADTVNVEFSASAVSITEGDSITFNDLSTGTPTYWKWKFDGGMPQQSFSQNPPFIHYNKSGKYSVSLYASNGTTQDSLLKSMYITVNPDSGMLIPNFQANKTKIVAGEKVNFKDMSLGNPSTWKWSFVGGTPASSSLQNASATYNSAGKYLVKLVVSNGTYTDSVFKYNYIEVAIDSTSINAKFSSNKTTTFVNDTVHFSDISTGKVKSREWTFVGGKPNKSSKKNPNVVYSAPGAYTVSLVVTDSLTYDTLTINNYITVLEDSTIISTLICDSITNILSNDTAVLKASAGTGYWAGNNSYGDLASAEYFSLYTSGSTLNTAIISFGMAKFSNPNSKVKVCVWDDSGLNNTPGNILASSDLKISAIANDVNSNKSTFVTFTNPPVISTPFYVGVQFQYTPGDTIALLSNTGLNNPTGNAWQMYNDSTWHDFSSAW